jgi:serine/threonine protein kinase
VAEFSNPETGLHAIAKHTENYEMASAESSAVQLLSRSSALFAPPLAAQDSCTFGKILISEYAGVSVEQLQPCWANEPLKVRVLKATQMLSCMLLAMRELASLPVPQLHRDFKSGNITWDEQLSLFRLIDYGLMIAADKSKFFPGCTISHIAPEMVLPQQPGGSKRPLCTAAGMAAATSSASDIWALFLTALRVLLGELPAPLNYHVFEELNGSQRGAQLFCDSLTAWSPDRCPQLRHLAAAYPQVAEVFKAGLAADPAQRLTVQQALQHEALADVVQEMQQRVKAAALAVARRRAEIRSLCVSSDNRTAAAADASEEDVLLIPATPVKEEECSCTTRAAGSSSSSSISSSRCVDNMPLGKAAAGAGSSCSSSSGTGSMPQQQQQQQQQQQPAAGWLSDAFGCFGAELRKMIHWQQR